MDSILRRWIAAIGVLALLASCAPPDEDDEDPLSPVDITVGLGDPEPSAPTDPAIEPAIAFSGTRIYLVYAQDDGLGDHDIMFTEKLTAGGYSAPAPLQVSPTADSRNPSCALDSLGTLHVVWEEGTAPNRDIYYATRTAGGTITATPLTATPATDEANPRIHVDEGDRLHIVWGSGGQIWYRRKTTSFFPAVQLPLSTTGIDGQTPDVVTDGGERVYVIWSENQGSTRDLRLLRSDDNGQNFAVETMAHTGTVVMTEPRIAGGIDGEVFLTFVGQDTVGDRGLFASFTRNGGVFVGLQQIHLSQTSGVRQPSIQTFRRADNGINIVIAFNDGTAAVGGNILVKMSHDAGLNYPGDPVNISIGSADPLNFNPDIRLDDNELIIVWQGEPTGGGVVTTFTSVSTYTLP